MSSERRKKNCIQIKKCLGYNIADHRQQYERFITITLNKPLLL